MANRDIIVIGGSAGSIVPIQKLISNLPPDLKASIFIVIHSFHARQSSFPRLIENKTTFKVYTPINLQKIEKQSIYFAPTNKHMLIHEDFIELTNGPKLNHVRPAIDALFTSAAMSYDSRVIGILMSGLLDDGSGGFIDIKAQGGLTIVQDPDEAEHPDMPLNAIENNVVDYSLTVDQIIRQLPKLINEKITSQNFTKQKHKSESDNDKLSDKKKVSHKGKTFIKGKTTFKDKIPTTNKISTKKYSSDQEITQLNRAEEVLLTGDKAINQIAELSPYTCPECNGSLWKLNHKNDFQYRCRIGHYYNLKTLSELKSDEIENAIWSAVRALEENASLSEKIAQQMKVHKNINAAKLYEEKSKYAAQKAERLRTVLLITDDSSKAGSKNKN